MSSVVVDVDVDKHRFQKFFTKLDNFVTKWSSFTPSDLSQQDDRSFVDEVKILFVNSSWLLNGNNCDDFPSEILAGLTDGSLTSRDGGGWDWQLTFKHGGEVSHVLLSQGVGWSSVESHGTYIDVDVVKHKQSLLENVVFSVSHQCYFSLLPVVKSVLFSAPYYSGSLFDKVDTVVENLSNVSSVARLFDQVSVRADSNLVFEMVAVYFHQHGFDSTAFGFVQATLEALDFALNVK